MRSLSMWLTTLSLSLLLSMPCQASLQPLEEFIQGAQLNNHDLLAAKAVSLQRQAEAAATRGKLLPGLDIGGVYTRNAYQAKFPAGPGGQELTIVPYNQLDASAALTVPIIDIVSWARHSVSRAQADAALATADQASLQLRAQVMMRYYALLGQEGLYQAALQRCRVAGDNLVNVQSREEVGSASKLDVARAQSDVAQAQQDVASALLQVQLSRRALETLSGVAPQDGGALGEAALQQEAPLTQWLDKVSTSLPPVREAMAQRKAARAGAHAARWGYLPTLNAKGLERFTNASGLNGGHSLVWQATLNFAWHFDLTLPATERALIHQHHSAQQAAESATRAAADRIFQDYALIEANIAKSAAARSQVEATRLGAQWATDRYAAGTITQLEVSQSQRDAFAAEAARIQADTDLLYYRAMLRLDAGMAPERLEDSP